VANKSGFTADSAGMEEFLTTSPELIAFMTELTTEVAASLEGRVTAKTDYGTGTTDVPIASAMHTTDRIAGVVSLMHPAGIPLEAKYGYLASAAESAGFEWGREWGTRGGEG
jgi:hypothetical protein